MKDPRRICLPAACVAASLSALSFSGCGNAPKPVSPPPPADSAASAASAAPAASAVSAAPSASASVAAKPFDPCDTSPPVPHPYYGILRVARCDQHMYLTMASVATQLGVECKHCHVVDPNDAKKEIYPTMTPKKEIANWMSMHLMQAVKPADGSKIKCKSCHTDEKGNPVAKILGNPRDPVKAHEWMSLVMVQKFVSASGEKLKCKNCHIGNYTTSQWSAKVLLHSDQIPKHQVGGSGPAL
jgi:hypothetical protein